MRLIYLISVMLLVSIVSAAIPTALNFQGRLTDSSNNPVNGTHNFTMRIYDAESGGNLLWTETQRSINVSNGVFTVEMGTVNAINLTFNADYWLQVEVTGENMTPRKRIVSNAYAFRANISDNLTCTSCVKSGYIESVDASKLTPGTFGGTGNYTFPANVSAQYFIGSGEFLTNAGTNISILHGKNPSGTIVPIAATAEGILILNVTQAEAIIAQTLADWATGNDLILLRYFRVGSGNLFTVNTSTSRVGIGTNAPTQELEVIGNITATNVTATYFIGSGALLTNITNVSLLYAYNSTVFTPVQTTSDGVLRLQVDEAQASGLSAGATGTNLTLTQWLNVSSNYGDFNTLNVRTLATLAGLNVSSLNISGYSDTLTLNVRNIAAIGGLNVSSLNISGYSDTLTLTVRNLASIGGLNVSSLNGSGYADVSSLNVRGLSTLLGVNATTALFSGNVGIGTTSPNFNAYASGNRALTIQGSDGSGFIELSRGGSPTSTSGIGEVSFFSTTTRNAGVLSNNDGATNSGNIQFWTNNAGTFAERMRITSAGNVGIGTTGPATKLHIRSDTTLINGLYSSLLLENVSGMDPTIHFRDESGKAAIQSTDGSIEFWVDNAGASADFVSGDQVVTITNTGNVGIGTTGPQALLYVNGGAVFINRTSEGQSQLRLRAPISSGSGTAAPADIFSGSVDSVADDNTVIIAASGIAFQGIGMFTFRASFSSSASALVHCRSTSSPAAVILSQGGSFTIAATTSDVTGTTGTDGQVTISCSNSGLEIENRQGGAITIGWFILDTES